MPQRVPPGHFWRAILGRFRHSENEGCANDSDQESDVSGHLGRDPAFGAKLGHRGVLDLPHVSGYH